MRGYTYKIPQYDAAKENYAQYLQRRAWRAEDAAKGRFAQVQDRDWSIFAMSWALVGWCASYDASFEYTQYWFGRRSCSSTG